MIKLFSRDKSNLDSLQACLEVPKSKYDAFILIFCVCYLFVAFYLFERLGHLDNLDKIIFSQSDSVGYLKISNFIVGKTSSIDEYLVKLRPFLFPLFLSIHNYVGVQGYVIIQLILNILSIVLVFNAVRILTGSLVFSFTGTVLMISNLTFTFIALHALTESLSILLIASTVYFIASYFTKKRLRHLLYSLFLLSASTCVKGVFIPFLVLWCCFVIYRMSNTLKTGRWIGGFIIAVVPIIIQLVFAYLITGSPSISTAGQVNFNNRYYPAVYGFAKADKFASYRSEIAKEARNKYPSLTGKIKFLIDNIGSTLHTSKILLRWNLLAGSSFIGLPEPLIRDQILTRTLVTTSKFLNALLLRLHILFFFLMCFCFIFNIKKDNVLFFVFMAILTYSILLLSILTYWQGDRIFIAALPVWAVLYPTVAYNFIHVLRNLKLTRRTETMSQSHI